MYLCVVWGMTSDHITPPDELHDATVKLTWEFQIHSFSASMLFTPSLLRSIANIHGISDIAVS